MNPKELLNPSATDETAMSGSSPVSAAADATAMSGSAPVSGGAAGTDTQADATIVRVAPSAQTVTEMSSPDNFGRYELLGEVARGGMGVVYKARQHGLDRTVALKMILGTGGSDEAAQRFLQEARAAAALDHPNVVPIYDIGESAGRPYFTMALIDGPNLRGYADAQGVMPIPLVMSMFAQVVAGVAHAHAAGIIHRDLKPANVLVDKDGRPRVTDFGLAKRATTDSHLTVTGQVVGTPSYMAPEQARDSKDVGPPADVYALGAILYFLLTGRPPFVGDGFADLLIKVVSDAPVPPRELRPDTPADVEELCLRCLAKKPGDRFADAQVLAEALVPITDQYVPASAGLSPSLARFGLSRASTPSFGTIPEFGAPPATAPALDKTATASLPRLPDPVPPAPAPVKGRGPLVLGLGVAAVLLVGAVAFFATRDKKPTDTAKQDPPAQGEPAPPVAPKGEKPLWGAPTRADFALAVEFQEPKDAEGTFQLIAGKTTLRLTAEKECRVFVWVIEPSGATTQLFPNDAEPDNRLTAGRARVVPGNDGYTLETSPTDGPGTERLRVLAVAGGPPAIPVASKREGKFPRYTGAEGEQLASAVAAITTRGIAIKKADGAEVPGRSASFPKTATDPVSGTDPVSETELKFRVK